MTEAGWTRERKLVDELLTFIEQTSGRKIKFSAIANLKTGVIEDPQDRIAAWLKRHLADSYQQGRVAGLREAAIICRERGKPHDIEWWQAVSKKEISRQTAIDCAELIEQYAQDEKGVMDAEN